jgi:glycosyltransferase involved in cell wall biosynthesis
VNNARPRFSIVVPVRNENQSVPELVDGIESALASASGQHEVLFVDDGSTDGTLETLKRISRQQPHVRVFSFRRGLGKSFALQCGFRMARGEYILTMDGDLQDDPRDLHHMHQHLVEQGLDIVSGWRKTRRDNAVKVVSSKIFNFIVRLLFGASFKDMNSGLKLYRTDAARELHLYGGMHRFIPLIATELGLRVAEVPVRHHERKYGSSNYRSTKILTQIPDLLTIFFLIKFTRRPLHFFGRIGTALFVVGFVCLAYLSFLWMQRIPIGTRPLLTFGVLLILVGGQIVFTGLLADLIVNMSHDDREQQIPLKYSSDSDRHRDGALHEAMTPQVTHGGR